MANNLLQDKRGLVFGALNEQSIAWQVAEKVTEEGAQIALTNAPVALRFGDTKKLAEQLDVEVFPADATDVEDLEKLLEKSQETLGGKLDFILHAVGMSPNVRKEQPYTDLNYKFLEQTLDVSALSLHKVLQTAYNMDAIREGGSVVTLSYIAAQRTFPGYNDMAEAKALLESIVRSFGYHYGKDKKVRINSISQSPTKTTAGSGVDGFDKFYDYADKMSPLGNASAEECADYCTLLFSDYTRKVTMQNLYHDGGFSRMGMSESLIEDL